jgi:hypothetical protein
MDFLDVFAKVMPYVNTAALALFSMIFFSSVYQKRFNQKFIIFVTFAVLFAIPATVNGFGIPGMNAVAMIITINTVGFVIYTPKLSTGLVYNQLYIMTVLLSDALTAYVFSARHGMTMEHFLSDDQVYAVAIIVNIAVVYAATRILTLFLTKTGKWKIRASEIFILIVIVIFELFIIVTLYEMTDSIKDVYRTIVVIAGFVILNIVTTLEIQKISNLYKSKYDLDIGKQQTKLEMSHYNELRANGERYRAVIHDIRKHLSILTAMSKNQPQEFYDYVHTLSERMERMFDEFRCHNRMLSIVMTQKIRAAEQADIRLILQVEDLDLAFMREADVTAIFANLWDNAIEAVRELPVPDRVIKVMIMTKNNYLMARFENLFTGEVVNEGENYVSMKGVGHAGAGLGIVRSAVENYGGRVILKSEAGHFSAMVMLPIREVKEEDVVNH